MNTLYRLVFPWSPLRRSVLAGALSAVFLFTATANAAEPPQPVPENVTVRFVGLQGMVTGFEVPSPTGPARIVARPRGFGPEVTALVRDGFVNLYAKSSSTPTSAPANGEVTPAGRFAVAPGVARYLAILVTPGPGGPGTCAVYAIPDPEGAHPSAHARVLNFTNDELAVRLAENTATIIPGASAVLASPGGADDHASFQFARQDGEGGWRLESSTRLAVRSGGRMFVIVTPSPQLESGRDSAMFAVGGAFAVRTLFDL